MRKIITASILFSILIATATPLRSQTRPRRVAQTAGVTSGVAAAARPEEQMVVVSGRERTVRREAGYERVRRGSRWPSILLGAGIAIGLGGIGHSGSCTPSRGRIIGLPRFTSRDSAPR